MTRVEVSREIAGRTLTIETGEIAKQAAGSVMVHYGGTTVFCAVTFGDPPPHLDFFPLTVDYREKTYAAGKFPGGFFKREGRPTTKEILTARLIDRPVRPLFPDGFKKDVSIACMTLSADRVNDPDILAMVAASAALSISPLPVSGVTGAVRVGYDDGEFLINPTTEERERSTLDLVVAGTRDAVMMVEAGAQEVSEQVILDALDRGHEVIREVVDMIAELTEKVGKEKLEFEAPALDEDLYGRVREFTWNRLMDAIETPGKHAKKQAMDLVKEDLLSELVPEEL
ncbi:MAG: polyribonucleotide nucleotidyltransferase, partial [Planctomycetes bacterium]|nr:polyribonucleotide nucleotidyltransferase [Planctomycetota bacterium]